MEAVYARPRRAHQGARGGKRSRISKIAESRPKRRPSRDGDLLLEGGRIVGALTERGAEEIQELAS